MSGTIRLRIGLGYGLALLGLAAIGAISYRSTTQFEANNRRVVHTNRVLADLDALLFDLAAAESAGRGYILAGEAGLFEAYSSAREKPAERMAHLRALTADNPSQQRRLDSLEPLMRQRLATLQETIELQKRRKFDVAALQTLTLEGAEMMDQLRAQIAQMQQEEHVPLEQWSQAADASARRVKTTILLGSLVAILVAALSAAMNLREIGGLQRAEEEIRKLNEDLERRVRQRTAELEAANRELEAFTYSVSHDLRAPLRHISGFAKILVEDFGPRMDPDAKHYLHRIVESTRYMGQLVDDLLSLARVGRQQLEKQVVGLNSLVEEVLAGLAKETQGRQID